MSKTPKNAGMSQFFANAFYHSKFMNSVFVVKASGELIEDDDALDGLIRANPSRHQGHFGLWRRQSHR